MTNRPLELSERKPGLNVLPRMPINGRSMIVAGRRLRQLDARALVRGPFTQDSGY